MAWTTPRTWVAGETVTASLLNTHLRDNLTELRSSLTCRAYRSTAQSIPNNTNTLLSMDAETSDTPNWHSTSANTDRITPDVAGLYLIVGQVVFAANSTGVRQAILYRNGTSGQYIASQGRGTTVSATEAVDVNVMGVYPANGTTDYFGIALYQNSGGALNTVADEGFTWLSVTFLGA